MLGRARNAGIAAAAAGVLAPVPAAPQAPPVQPGPGQKSADGGGYRDSERNRRYYALARY